MNLTEKSERFLEWLGQLEQVTSDKTGHALSEIKINEDEAYKWFDSGFTPAECFRETWGNEQDSEY